MKKPYLVGPDKLYKRSLDSALSSLLAGNTHVYIMYAHEIFKPISKIKALKPSKPYTTQYKCKSSKAVIFKENELPQVGLEPMTFCVLCADMLYQLSYRGSSVKTTQGIYEHQRQLLQCQGLLSLTEGIYHAKQPLTSTIM